MTDPKLTMPAIGGTEVPTRSAVTTQSKAMTFTVEELLDKIDKVKNVGFGPEPSLLEMLVSSGARDLKRTIEEAKASSIRARKELIDGLASCINIYIDTHKSDLKIRGSAFVTATFATLTGKMNAIMESVITSFFETYAKTISDYERIPNLDDAIRSELRRQALERAMRIAGMSQNFFFEILDNLKDQVVKLSNEIGER